MRPKILFPINLMFNKWIFSLAFFIFLLPEIVNAKQIKFIATGDVIPARSVNSIMVRQNDFTYPFLQTASLLKKADVVLINLEAPLIENCPVTDEGMVFCGDPRFIKGLKFANIKVANLANNHSGNYGNEGLDSTVKLLKNNGLKISGLGKPAFLKKNGIRLAFLGFNDIAKNPYLKIALAEPKMITKQIKQAKKKADFVIVSFHWGDEYTAKPNSRQRFLAHLAIDSGADLIIGNHPHWVQSKEKYQGKLINYALGNFIFDQMWSDETRKGILGWYVIEKNKGLVKTKYYPVLIENYSQPRFL